MLYSWQRAILAGMSVLFLQANSLSKHSGRVLVSYYADAFEGKTTASGEIYAAKEETAAHRTLPIGTEVQLRNPENGKWTNVRVNDRGPHITGRDFDLSRGAAKKLGIEKKGVALLEVQALHFP